MTRFATQADMTADEITDCSYDLLAILRVEEVAARHLHDQHSPVTADALARVLSLAVDLHAPIHDALESHDDRKRIAPVRMTGGGRNG